MNRYTVIIVVTNVQIVDIDIKSYNSADIQSPLFILHKKGKNRLCLFCAFRN